MVFCLPAAEPQGTHRKAVFQKLYQVPLGPGDEGLQQTLHGDLQLTKEVILSCNEILSLSLSLRKCTQAFPST